MRTSHIIIYGLPGSSILFQRYLINGTVFGKKKGIEHKMCFDFLCRNLDHSKEK